MEEPRPAAPSRQTTAPFEVDEIFLRALELDESQRARFLADSCAGNESLIAEVVLLLEAAAAESPLDRPLFDAADQVLETVVEDLLQVGDLSGTRLGSYRLGALRGEGGMGEVYEARRVDGVFERRVAVKVLRAEMTSLENRNRFDRETQLLAELAHPHIVPIFDGGVTTDGRPYLVMAWIDGSPIVDHCSAAEIPLDERVRLMVSVCEAASYAHQHGIVHRDLKPSNVLVETTKEGTDRVLLVDFGIAKPREGVALTQIGHTLGTPGYMSPESARGEASAASRTSDVFSIGAILYELVSGTPLYAGSTEQEIWSRAREGDFRPPREVAPAIDPALEAIVLTALEPDSQCRYQSATALGDDLERWRAGRPSLLGARWSVRSLSSLKRTLLSVPLMSAAALICLLTVGIAFWAIETKQSTAERTKVSGLLGRQIERAESLIRAAHTRPFHDVGSEYSSIGEPLEQMVDEFANTADLQSYGSYVLGRLAWATRDLSAARQHFLAAREGGIAEPDFELRLGLVLAEIILQREVDDSVFNVPTAPSDFSAGADAVALLAAGRPHAAAVELGSEEYVDGLIALLEDRFEAVAPLMRQARSEAPWLYQASVIDALASEQIGLAKILSGDRQSASLDFERAIAAIDDALQTGRSDPQLVRTRCRLTARLHCLTEALSVGIALDSLQARLQASTAVCAEAPRPGRSQVP